MTDKEQIMIDGKGCRYKTWDKDCALTGDNHGDNMKPCKFIDEKNCYFKQLARKTQECEALKSESFTMNSLIIEQEEEIDRYRKVLEKIEECINNLKKQDILTFPDFSLQENCKVIMKQCNEGYRQILNIINKAKGEV